MISIQNKPQSSTAWPSNWREDWKYHDLFDKLVFQHGHDRARSIVRGEDPATNADLAAWRGLGR